AFKLVRTRQFENLQKQTLKNALAISEQLKSRGLRIPYGGTNSHMLNVDTGTVKGPDGSSLSGDQAARILDLAGIVVNRNTIPGDRDARDPSGIRLGTPWITQRGFDEQRSRQLADLMADILLGATPHFVDTPREGRVRRAKVDFNLLNEARIKVRGLASAAGIDFEPAVHGYPHFYYLDDKVSSGVFELEGERVRQLLDYAVCTDLSTLKPGRSAKACLNTPQGTIEGAVTCQAANHYRLTVPLASAALAAIWLRDLSDGYLSFNLDGSPDPSPRRMPGPVVVICSSEKPAKIPKEYSQGCGQKPWYLGAGSGSGKPLPDFRWAPLEESLRRTPLYEAHKNLGARIIPFAGWEMPVWYSSVMEEHLATRQAAGLFDVAHMGVYQVEGPDAASFLDTVCSNDCGGLNPGESLYTHFLTPEAQVVDDTLVYRRAWEKFLVVVNASNDDKDRAWLEAVRDGKVRIDNTRPWARTYGYEALIRNLRDPKSGDEMRVDIAIQGPRSRDILLALGVGADARRRINALKRTELCDAKVGGFDLVVSRTGYTGEKMAFELFVHPEKAVEFWNATLKTGEKFGLKPVGLGARDSLRTEAGLPLYGHEMGVGSGKQDHPDLGVAEGGFGAYVKTYKPWFIGREAYLAREQSRKGVVVRFRFGEKGVRMAHNGDPVVDRRGRVIGWVTSCAVDIEGYLTGQAYLETKYAEEGAPILVYQGAPNDGGKAPAEMKLGDKAPLPTAAVVVSRFAKL
ncbi:MAG: glycine cleavage system aminomethyltransferase GcvT, partial [Chloroflexi bacterium]|nr:glycine cleavage system aminomethyltransferase GcvT [Chloroflexota bacterium]